MSALFLTVARRKVPEDRRLATHNAPNHALSNFRYAATTFEEMRLSAPELKPEEVERIVSDAAATLAAELRAVFDRYAVPAFVTAYEFEGVRGPTTAPVWVVARSGSVVLGYDEAEEEYGVGTLRDGGLLERWGIYDRLEWALRSFAAAVQPAPPAA